MAGEDKSARTAASVVTSEKQVLDIEYQLEPLVSLRHNFPAARRVEPVMRDVMGRIVPARVLARYSDEDVETIDRMTIDFAADLPAGTQTMTQLPLILPMSFRTMCSRRGRNALVKAAAGSTLLLKQRIIVELIDVDRGTPMGRLTEVAGLVGAVCRGVFARIQPGREIIFPPRDARLQGLTIDGADLAGADGDAASQLLELGEQARGISPMLAAQGLADEGYFAVAEVAGFTHCALRPRTDPVEAA